MKKTTIFLSISILLNIFLIGYLTGNQFLRKKHHGGPHHHPPHISKELRHEMKTKRKELFKIIVAEEFDEAAFDAKAAELAAIHDKIRLNIPQRIKEKALGKTQEERIRLVKRIKHRFQKRSFR